MTTTNVRHDGGFSLVEMVIVMALLGTTLAVVFGAVNVLTLSASTSTEESAAARDLSYSMELLSKTLMGSTVLYAGDNQIVVLTQVGSSAWQVSSITATTGVAPATRGQLIWERWSTDASGTAQNGVSPIIWVMSDRNMNRYTTPPTALFTYYTSTGATLTAADWISGAGAQAPAFTAVPMGGYTVTGITRIRLHIMSAFNAGVHDDYRDIVLRLVGS